MQFLLIDKILKISKIKKKRKQQQNNYSKNTFF